MSLENNENTSNRGLSESLGDIVALNSDLFFGVRISNQLKAQGYAVSLRKSSEAFAEQARTVDAVLGVIDLNAKPDWERIAAFVNEVGEHTPVLVFGSHLDVDGLRAAKAAGARRVVSNGEFHQNMIELVKRYARSPAVVEAPPLNSQAAPL